jgi:ferredoxin
VCPTGAIRALPLEEKKAARMGLAVVDPRTCLPMAGREACQRCVDECVSAGYSAIEFTQVGAEVNDSGEPIEGTGFLAPVVLPERCVGCGLCQTGCYVANVKGANVHEKRLERSAIVVQAGDGKEDRLLSGSYLALREEEAGRRQATERRQRGSSSSDYYVPGPIDESPDPFGSLERDRKPVHQKPQTAEPSDPFGLGAP